MGTLGCINDMLQRDKENHALRKLNRERMRGHYNYLVEKGKGVERRSDVSVEQLEEIRKNTAEKERSDQVFLRRAYLFLILCFAAVSLLGWFCYRLFSSRVA